MTKWVYDYNSNRARRYPCYAVNYPRWGYPSPAVCWFNNDNQFIFNTNATNLIGIQYGSKIILKNRDQSELALKIVVSFALL